MGFGVEACLPSLRQEVRVYILSLGYAVPPLGAVTPNPTCSLVLLEVFLGQAEVMAYLVKKGLTDLLDEFFFG